MIELSKRYEPKSHDPKWQEHWEKNDIYRWDKNASREESYVIDTPPPTVSGHLHMGHVFSYTQADFVARFQRMKGKSVFYPMGFDDNGLPTERLVEKVKKVKAQKMERSEFIALCQDVVKEAEQQFRELFEAIAISVDWQQEYQTISERSRRLSQMSFLHLLDIERAYRTFQPTLWDPVDGTALAQTEVEDKEMASHMVDVTFADDDGNPITIATTRPEMLPACVAVLYHPEDARYKHLKNKKAITPLFSVEVPLIEDTHVDPEKGSGLVMCCTFGDVMDIEWWKAHQLPLRIILNHYGRLAHMESLGGDDWPSRNKEKAHRFIEEINNMTVKQARTRIIELLKEENLLTQEKDIMHMVKCAERSGAPLEILVSKQWCVRVLDQKEEIMEKAAQANWYPEYMKVRFDNWVKGLQWDWCISRQRYFGVPFPVWYSKRAGEEGKMLTAHPEDLPVDPLHDLPRGYTKDEVEPDTDVMDTWATSGLTPQLNSWGITDDYADDINRHKQLYPADLRPQAHEIIRTWAFATVVKSHFHEQKTPWKDVMISGWCLASDKTKMSKSKGNVVTPHALIDEKGADVVRYWASTSHLGADTAYSEDVMSVGKKLVNKLWNAAKFASSHFTHLNGDEAKSAKDLADAGSIREVTDLWVLTRLRRTIDRATQEFERYEYCRARQEIEHFFWNDFCDNYLELVKGRVYDPEGTNPEGQQSACLTLYHVLDHVLRLFAPFIPHITEELYQAIYPHRADSIHQRGNWPDMHLLPQVEDAEAVGIVCVHVLDAIRKAKAERNVSIKTPIEHLAIISNADEHHPFLERLKHAHADLANVSNAQHINYGDATQKGNDPIEVQTEDERYTVHVQLALEAS